MSWQIGSGGILNATDAITVDGDDAANLVVQDGGAVGIATSSVLNIGGTTEDDNASGELVLAGTGAIIGPSTVALNGGASEVDFEMTASYTFANDITGIGASGAIGAGVRHLDRRQHLLRRHAHRRGHAADRLRRDVGFARQRRRHRQRNPGVRPVAGSIAISNAISGSGGVSFSGGGEFELAADQFLWRHDHDRRRHAAGCRRRRDDRDAGHGRGRPTMASSPSTGPIQSPSQIIFPDLARCSNSPARSP